MKRTGVPCQADAANGPGNSAGGRPPCTPLRQCCLLCSLAPWHLETHAFVGTQNPPRDGHPCCSARSSRHQVSKGLSPSSHFPVGFRLPVSSARHGAARHAWRSRGRDAGCTAPPAQIRTCALTHTAPTFGSDRSPLDRRIRSTAWYTVPRHCVRSVLWSRKFPLVMGLGSTNSATARTALFASFSATMPMSHSIRAVHHRLTASRLPDAVPAVTGTTRRPPRSRHMTYVRA